ncbi:MAG: MFS transporter [Candidatus Paceibacterota bacterium]|jgi:MFS family permease
MHPRTILFIGNFFFSIFTALAIYVTLPFLSSFMSDTAAGLVVSFGGIISVAIFPFLPRLVARYGAQRLTVAFTAAEMIAVSALAIVPSAFAGALFIILGLAVLPLISYELDLLLEAISTEKSSVARTRTAFLTSWNFGSLAAPLLLGLILANSNEYGRVFLVAAVMLVPFLALFAGHKLPAATVPKITHMQDTLVCISHDRDFSAVTIAHFLLYLFYIWAPLYVPIYLHDSLGIPWSELGWMFAVMLIPYALVEYPAGWVADRYLGDKKLMLAGFIIAGLALASFGMLSPKSPLVLILFILVGSRVGAALVESMTEGHFFRRITEQDINSMSIFRGIWPLANVIGPIVGSLILYYSDFQTFFALTGGFIILAGSIATLSIKDYRPQEATCL